MGMSEGGSLAALFAATYPQRCEALVLYGCFARFTSWLPTDEAFEAFLSYIDQYWGTGGSLPLFERAVGVAVSSVWGKSSAGARPSKDLIE